MTLENVRVYTYVSSNTNNIHAYQWIFISKTIFNISYGRSFKVIASDSKLEDFKMIRKQTGYEPHTASGLHI